MGKPLPQATQPTAGPVALWVCQPSQSPYAVALHFLWAPGRCWLPPSLSTRQDTSCVPGLGQESTYESSHESLGQKRSSELREPVLLGPDHTTKEAEIWSPVGQGFRALPIPGLGEPAGGPCGLTDTPWLWVAKEGVCPSCQGGPTRPAWARGSLPDSHESVRSLAIPAPCPISLL